MYVFHTDESVRAEDTELLDWYLAQPEQDERQLEDAAWATPGVTGLGSGTAAACLPAPSAHVVALLAAVERLQGVDPTALPDGQALVDAQTLLQVEQQLRVLDLRRLGDVSGRALFELDGFRSAGTWARTHRPDGDSSDLHLASQLRFLPALRAAVEAGQVPLVSARKVVAVLSRCSSHLDREDGLVDAQPADELFPAVVANAMTFICRDLAGLHDGDPRLAALVATAQELLQYEGSQGAWLEAITTWLAGEVRPRTLSKALEEIQLSVLPSILEEKGEEGRRARGLTLEPKADGSGWTLCGDLDLETGERLWTVLRSEVARDSANAEDTAAWADGGKGRSRRERLHDALSAMAGRYLSADLGGSLGKNPVQVLVTLSEGTVTGLPGAAPAQGASGRMIPRALVRKWWCDASVSAYVMSLGGKALRVIHGQRTLSGAERRALSLESGARCVGEDCCSPSGAMFAPTRPHHVRGFAEDQVTSLEDTVPVCDRLHHDLHTGKRTVRLRDGRYLNEHGFVDAVAYLPAPF